jgi:hypothetical protein
MRRGPVRSASLAKGLKGYPHRVGQIPKGDCFE